jgi:hypothetical protein
MASSRNLGPTAAMASLTSLVLDIINKDLDRKATKDAQYLNILSQRHREASNSLDASKSNFNKAKISYESILGNVPDIEATQGVNPIKNNMSKWYQDDINRLDKNKTMYSNEMERMLKEIADITKVQNSISSTAFITPDEGIKGAYDEADLSLSRISKIFNIDENIVRRWNTQNPEQIPAAIRKLESTRIKYQHDTGKSTEDIRKEGVKNKKEFISGTVPKSPVFNNIDAILQSDDLNDTDKYNELGKITFEGPNKTPIPLGVLLDETTRINEDDNKKVREAKMKKRSKAVQEFATMVNSFTDTSVKNDDMIGMNKFIKKMNNFMISIPEIERAKFKESIYNMFHIDLDQSDNYTFASAKKSVSGKGFTVKGSTMYAGKDDYKDKPILVPKKDKFTSPVRDYITDLYKKDGADSLPKDFFESNYTAIMDITNNYINHIATKELTDEKRNLILTDQLRKVYNGLVKIHNERSN